jgi:hypothetical protein
LDNRGGTRLIVIVTNFWQGAALVIISGLGSLAAGATEAATLAGQQVRTGPLIEIRFPVSKYFKDIAAQFGNPRPDMGLAVVTFPPGFDPSKPCPIVIVTSSTDSSRTNPKDAYAYHEAADHEGWMILAADFTIRPHHDSTPWRLAMLGAALEAVRKEWPQSARWPVAFGGFSGGAKRSCVLGAMLAKGRAIHICGFFLSGINHDVMSEAYKTYQPGADFLNAPIWIDGGLDDKIATPGLSLMVKTSMERTGFKRVRFENFLGFHQLRIYEEKNALRWFRQLGGF